MSLLPPDWLLILVFAVGVGMMVRTISPLNTADIFHLQFAAYQWHKGTPENIYSTYEDDEWDRWMVNWLEARSILKADSFPNLHFYPPIVSAVLAPAAGLPAKTWLTTMAAINILLMFVVAMQILAFADLPRSPRYFLWALALTLACNGFVYCIKFGQISAVLSVFTWTGLLAFLRGEWTKGTSIIGATSVVKLSPVSLFLLPLIKGNWKSVVVGCLTLVTIFGAGILWLGVGIHREWWRVTQYLGNHVWPNPLDQSITAWYTRAVKGFSIDAMYFHATPDITTVRVVASMFFLGTAAVLLWHARKNNHVDCTRLSIGVLLCAILLTLPFAWSYYLIILLPVMGWALAKNWSTLFTTLRGIWLLLAVFLICFRLHHFYGDTPFRSFITGSHTLGVLLLWSWCSTGLLRQNWREVQDDGAIRGANIAG